MDEWVQGEIKQREGEREEIGKEGMRLRRERKGRREMERMREGGKMWRSGEIRGGKKLGMEGKKEEENR